MVGRDEIGDCRSYGGRAGLISTDAARMDSAGTKAVQTVGLPIQKNSRMDVFVQVSQGMAE